MTETEFGSHKSINNFIRREVWLPIAKLQSQTVEFFLFEFNQIKKNIHTIFQTEFPDARPSPIHIMLSISTGIPENRILLTKFSIFFGNSIFRDSCPVCTRNPTTSFR